MAFTNELERGLAIRYNNDINIVLDFQSFQKGRGGSNLWVKLRSLSSGKIIETFKWSEKVLDCIAVDPGGRQAAIVEDDSRWAHLLNPATGERKFTLKAHKRFINCAALSSNGRWLATGGGDGTVVLWATDTGTATLTSTHHKCIRPDPRGSIVEDVRFDRAGKTLFTSGRDGWVRAFEVPKA